MSVNSELLESAFSNRMETYAINNVSNTQLEPFFEDAYDIFRAKQDIFIVNNNMAKTYAQFIGDFVKDVMRNNPDGSVTTDEITQTLIVNTPVVVIDRGTNLRDIFQTFVSKIIVRIESFEQDGSGWRLSDIRRLVVFNHKFSPIRASSYIPLPKWLKNKRCMVNVMNEDVYCFVWAVLAGMKNFKKNEACRVSSYKPFRRELNTNGLVFPLALSSIDKFEKLNNHISVNVYTLENKNSRRIIPVRLTRQEFTEHHVHLFLMKQTYFDTQSGNGDDCDDDYDDNWLIGEDNMQIEYHYCTIRSLSKLLSAQLNRRVATYICDRCLIYFGRESSLKLHMEKCRYITNCAVEMPNIDRSILKFQNYRNSITLPFVIYADIETLLRKVNDSQTNVYQKHQPIAVGYYIESKIPDVQSRYRSYCGKDCIDWLCNELSEFHKIADRVFSSNLPIRPLSTEEYERFYSRANNTVCGICCEQLDWNNRSDICRDHDHYTGEPRFICHRNCNLNYQQRKIIPILFHNLTSFDSMFLITTVLNHPLLTGTIEVLPVSGEKFVSFTKYVGNRGQVWRNTSSHYVQYKFIDSYRFLPSSLSELARILPSEKKLILHKEFSDICENSTQMNMLESKAFFPYDWLDCEVKLDFCELPSHAEFYNALNDTMIDENEYRSAQQVWNTFRCATIRDYLLLYLRLDVILLTDICENFRNTTMQTFSIEPFYYNTAAALSFDAMLKHTKVELERIRDIDQYLFIESSIRGGICVNNVKYLHANNPHIPNVYDASKEISYICSWDVNGLYSFILSQSLPMHSFSWCSNIQNESDIFKLLENPNTGCIIEADFCYDSSLHDAHDDFPFLPEKKAVTNSKYEKLLLTLHNKEKYVLHHSLFVSALKYGLRVTKIHRVLKFFQSPWMQPYFDLCTSNRMNATNDFDRNQFKNAMNFIFGRSLLNPRRYRMIKVKARWEGRFGIGSLIGSPFFKKSKLIGSNTVIIEMNRSKVCLDSPLYIGMSVLDMSKAFMYEFRYGYLATKFGSNLRCVYFDTDAITMNITAVNFYELIKDDIPEYFDTSSYAVGNEFGIERWNRSVPGKFKDEQAGIPIAKFVCLRPKCYCVQTRDEKIVKKAKGVRKCVQRKITFDDYINCLRTHNNLIMQQRIIKSRIDNVSSVVESRIVLCSDDNKRFWLPDGVNSRAFGHYANNII